jgi:hypothetical protein
MQEVEKIQEFNLDFFYNFKDTLQCFKNGYFLEIQKVLADKQNLTDVEINKRLSNDNI